MKKESDFQTRFSRWVYHNWNKSTAFELKLSKKDSIPFSNVQEHQIAALLAAKHGKSYHKISDESRGQKPYDCYMIAGGDAYVVIMFYLERGDRTFYMIDIDTFVEESKTSKRRSLTKKRAEEIGTSYSL